MIICLIINLNGLFQDKKIKFVMLPVGQVGEKQFCLTMESLTFIVHIFMAHFDAVLKELCDNKGTRKDPRWHQSDLAKDNIILEHVLAQFFPGKSFALLKNPAGHSNPRDRPPFIESRMQYFDAEHSAGLFFFFF